MALKDMDVGVKVLGGVVVFALLMALMSNGDPENDAWGAGESVDDEDVSGDDRRDPWSAVPEDGEVVPACDGVAPFATDDGTIRLPVHGPVVPFPSAVCQLGPGSDDAEAVRALQHALAACNGQGIAADGVYGAGTEDAVAAVQAGLGLEVDGIYGPQTRVAMSWPTEPEAPADHAAEAGDGLEDDPEGVLDVDAGARPSSACISGG